MTALDRVVSSAAAILFLSPPVSHAQVPCDVSGAAALYGTVRSESDQPVPGVAVIVTWASGGTEAASGEDGSYVVCGVPAQTPISIIAAGASALGNRLDIELPAPSRYELDLTVNTVSARGPAGGATGGILGAVVDADTGEPIAGARVAVPEASVEAVTGGDGTFRLADIPSGSRSVVVEHIRYGKRQADVTVPARASAVVRLRMTVRPVAVAPIEVVVEGTRVHALETRGFYERRRWAEVTGRGRFFTTEDIRRRNPRLISHLIADVPGTVLDCSRSLRSRTCVLRFLGSGCRANVYIDGAPAIRSDNQSGAMGLDNLIAPQEVAAIEVYPSAASLPAEFSGSTGSCGAIVIWSK